MPSTHPTFDPDALFTTWSTDPTPPTPTRPFATAIKSTFSLPEQDKYIYHAAPSSLTLSQAQSAINAGRANNLHAWYRDTEDGKPIPPPPPTDIEAYTNYFSATNLPPKALKSLAANAKKSTLRASVAQHLISLRVFPPGEEVKITRDKTFVNPAADFWAWSCRELEWGGPIGDDAALPSRATGREGEGKEGHRGVNVAEQLWVKMSPQSHHVLPVLMHHFGCVVPTWEAITLLTYLTSPRNTNNNPHRRSIYDIGSGNGYWTYLLRRHSLDVTPVDDGQSEWRTLWVQDTIAEDGASFLRRNGGAREGVLLLVYPVTQGEFVEGVVGAFEGDVVVVAGTMNRSGFTGFRERKVGEWMVERGWRCWARVPLPSFAGKDEGMEVFVRGEGV